MSSYELYMSMKGLEGSKATFDEDTRKLFTAMQRSQDKREAGMRGDELKREISQFRGSIDLQVALANAQSREFMAQETNANRLENTILTVGDAYAKKYDAFNISTVLKAEEAAGSASLRGDQSSAAAAIEAFNGGIANDPVALGRDPTARAATLREINRRLEESGQPSLYVENKSTGRFELGPAGANLTVPQKASLENSLGDLNLAKDEKIRLEQAGRDASVAAEEMRNARSAGGATLRAAQENLNNALGKYGQAAANASAANVSAEDARAKVGSLEFAQAEYMENDAYFRVVRDKLFGTQKSFRDHAQEWVEDPKVQAWLNDRDFRPPVYTTAADGTIVAKGEGVMLRAMTKFFRERERERGEYLPRYGEGLTDDIGVLITRDPETGEERRLKGVRLMTHGLDNLGDIRLAYTDPATGEKVINVFGKDEYALWDSEEAPIPKVSASTVEAVQTAESQIAARGLGKAPTASELARIRAPVEWVSMNGKGYAVAQTDEGPRVTVYDPETNKLVAVSDEEAIEVRKAALQDGSPVVNADGQLMTPDMFVEGAELSADTTETTRAAAIRDIRTAAGFDPDVKPIEAETEESFGRTERRKSTRPRERLVSFLPREEAADKIGDADAQEIEETRARGVIEDEQEAARTAPALPEPPDIPTEDEEDEALIEKLESVDKPKAEEPEAEKAAVTPPPSPAKETAEEATASFEAEADALKEEMAQSKRDRDARIRAAVVGGESSPEEIRQAVADVKAAQAAKDAVAAAPASPVKPPSIDAPETQAEILDVITGGFPEDGQPAERPTQTPSSTGPIARADAPSRQTMGSRMRSILGLPPKMDRATAQKAAVAKNDMVIPGQTGESDQAVEAAQTPPKKKKDEDDDGLAGAME
jgi:hypothetical protein